MKRLLKKVQKVRRPFTLFEVMLAIGLLLLATGFMGWNMHEAVKKKRFRSDLNRLEVRFGICRRLAVAMQADWRGILKRSGKGWIFEVRCEDSPKAKNLAPLKLDFFSLSFEGEKVDEISLEFFSTGEVFPHGIFLFRQDLTPKAPSREWKFPECLQKENEKEKRIGPIHPDEVF